MSNKSSSTRDKLREGFKKRESSVLSSNHLQNLQSSLRRGQTPLSKHRIFDVPIEKIKENPFQSRFRESLKDEEIKNLGNSISQYGLQTPIQLRRIGEELYLVSGWRRITAIKKYVRSMTSVQATITENMDDSTHRLMTIIENEQRKNLTRIERAYAYKDLIDNEGFTQLQVAQFVGSSNTRISRALKLLDLPKSLIEEINKLIGNGIEDGHIDDLATFFSKIKDKPDALKITIQLLKDCSEKKINVHEFRGLLTHTLQNLLGDNKETDNKKKKKPIKTWKIKGGKWKKFESTTRNRILLEFILPDNYEYNDTKSIVSYIKTTLLPKI